MSRQKRGTGSLGLEPSLKRWDWPFLRAQTTARGRYQLFHLPFRMRPKLAAIAAKEGLSLRVRSPWTVELLPFVPPDLPRYGPPPGPALLRPREVIRVRK